MGSIYHTARCSSPDKGRVLLPQDMRISMKGDSSSLERPKKTSAHRNHSEEVNTVSLLLGTEWEQIIRSEVPFEVLEEVQVVFLEVLGML
jgi:hypothetical protein